MKAKQSFDSVAQCVQEICDYYTSCNHLFGNSILVSKTMLAYALQLKTVDALEPILHQLKQQGAVLTVNGDAISFSNGFVQGLA
jgi:hypothetical protein